MSRSRAGSPWCAFLASALLAALGAGPAPAAEPYVWVDENGVTHLTNDAKAVPEHRRHVLAPADPETLARLWDDGILGARTGGARGDSGSQDDRVTRLLRGAVDDLRRGESSRASAALTSALRLDPARAEAHWYLALLSRQRGRYERSAEHLQRFLDHAGPAFRTWRASAERRLAALDDERRLAEGRAEGPLRLVARRSPNFRVEVDAELASVRDASRVKGRAEYAATVLGYLEDARAEVSSQLGVQPDEPLGVVLYGKARYDREHSHRFSFATVGFFDGRIHVASPAHPAGGLRALLFHEYTHALYREQTGGDRPYWLNEGLAERIERASRRMPTSTRSERAAIRARIETGDWIPLRSIARSFAGLGNDDARAAYLQSVLAAEWLERRTTRASRARLLRRLGEGFSIDQALHEAVGVDTEGLDTALQADILGEFPELGAGSAGSGRGIEAADAAPVEEDVEPVPAARQP